MKKHLVRIIDSNWFFVSLVLFVVVLPFSQALVSILSGIILLTALIEDHWRNKIDRIRQNKILLFIPAIFFIYILSSIGSGNLSNSFYDIRKSFFFLILPFAFMFGKEITSVQKRYLFYIFSFAIIISTIVAILNWKLSINVVNFGVHKASLISHIRFSFQLLLAFWFFILLIQKNYKNLEVASIGILLLIAMYLLSFLLFQQSLTGLTALIISLVFYIFLLIFRTKSKYKVLLIILLVGTICLPLVYISHTVIKFYDFEKVDENMIDKRTERGNLYQHNFENQMVENGKYVYIYVCEKEMREEWNKLSDLKYDSIGLNGYTVNSTLIRYLTSKGLRKDATGILALSHNDIQNIENGIANIIFQNKKFSLYPRVYQSVWEYYVYSKTGYSDHQSFSQRIEFAKAAITIIKNNFWFGVGTGNWEEEFNNAYIANNSKLSKSLYASSHNQYLNYLVKFGFIGFLFILFFIIYPVIKTKRYKDNLFLLFLVFMFFVNFADSNFESHMGSSFFVFFYCLFIITECKDYLLLDPKTRF